MGILNVFFPEIELIDLTDSPDRKKTTPPVRPKAVAKKSTGPTKAKQVAKKSTGKRQSEYISFTYNTTGFTQLYIQCQIVLFAQQHHL